MGLFPLLTLLSVAIASTSVAQAPPVAPAPSAQSAATIGFMHAIHATRDAATTLAFYTDVFGIAGEVRPFENRGVPLLTNSPGVTLRVAMLQIPGRGFNFELTQFSNVERRAAQPEVFDPGAPHMKIFVRDLEPVVTAVTKLGATVVTRSGAPVRVSMRPFGAVDAIMFRDPDGYLVEAVKAPPPADAPPGNVLGSMMGVTVADLDQSLEFWQGLLGFELKAIPRSRATGRRSICSGSSPTSATALPKAWCPAARRAYS